MVMAFSRPFLWAVDLLDLVGRYSSCYATSRYYDILHLAILAEELKRKVYYGESSYNTG